MINIIYIDMYELIATLLILLVAAHYLRVIKIPQMGEPMTLTPPDSIMGVPESTLVVPKKEVYKYQGDMILP